MSSEARKIISGAWWSRTRSVLGRMTRMAGRPRRLHLEESLPLGERRFVAVIEFEQSRFLIGGTPSSLVLLAHLREPGQREGRDTGSPVSQIREWGQR
jgi:flagellar biogenesis protein FliO